MFYDDHPISCYFYVSRGWKIDLKLVRLSDCVWPSSSSCSTTIIANSGLFCDPSFQSWEENFSYKKVLVQAQKRTIYCRSNCYALVTVVSLVFFLQKTPNHLKIYQFLMQLRHLPSKFQNPNTLLHSIRKNTIRPIFPFWENSHTNGL